MQLNESTQKYKTFLKQGRNTYVSQMSRLMFKGRIPLSMADLMKRRLEVINASKPVREEWFYGWFITGDGILYYPSGKGKIVLDAQLLREITPSSKFSNGALKLDTYTALEGLKLSKKELEKYADGKWHRQKDILNNRVWRILARHPNEVPKELAENSDLLKEYSHLVFSQGYGKAMGIYASLPKDAPTMRAWYMDKLHLMSDAKDNTSLDISNVCLVGVLPQKSIIKPTLEQITAIINPYIPDHDKNIVKEQLEKLYEFTK